MNVEDVEQKTIREVDALCEGHLARVKTLVAGDPYLRKTLHELEVSWRERRSDYIRLSVVIHSFKERNNDTIIKKLRELRSSIEESKFRSMIHHHHLVQGEA